MEAQPHAAHRPDPTGDRADGWQPAATDLDAALEEARRGSEAGFSVLWRTLHPPLLRYLTVRGDDAPEDVAAETWLQVIRDLGGFRGDAAGFRAWLFTVARHRAIDQGRARAARPVVPVAEPGDEGAPRARAQRRAGRRGPGRDGGRPSPSWPRCPRTRRRW